MMATTIRFRAFARVSTIAVLLLAVLLLAVSCSFASRRAGVANLWRESGRLDGVEAGVSRVGDVLDRLGPPSQMVAVGERTLLYYLLEQSDTESLFLAVYNDAETRISYDRAVFLFDADGVLREMALSDEVAAIPVADDA